MWNCLILSTSFINAEINSKPFTVNFSEKFEQEIVWLCKSELKLNHLKFNPSSTNLTK